MKKVFFSFLSLFSLFLFSCSDLDSFDYGLGAYYVEIVTATEKNVFLLDTGKEIRNVGGKNSADFETGDRVYLVFSYTEETKGEIEIHSSTKIFQKDPDIVQKEEIAKYANDPVSFQSAWIGSHYLNLHFYIEYKSIPHKIFLIMEESQANDKEIKLYFRHDAGNDTPGYPSPVYTSFNLSGALGEPQGDRILLINFNTTNYGDKVYKFKY
ncbi:MAG: hypothetical protein LBG15_13090 [Dysgonamonadaceae bacterium]|jgi:hypothetical protein|nr:hypothetical protein [Dysgonamonadaceae bacterium]